MAYKQSKILSAIATVAFAGGLSVVQAAPLTSGTTLGIDQGNGSSSAACTAGSCFSMEVFTGFFVWTNVAAGNDGGIIIGKNQASGGQDTESVGETTDTSGDMTAAWTFYQAWGTFFGDMGQNTFSDTSNDGMTVVNDFNVAWNGMVMQLGGGTVNDYTINLDADGNGTYSIDYSQVVASGPFTGVPFRMLLKGTVIAAPLNNPPIANDLYIFTEAGTNIDWVPDVSDADGDLLTCLIAQQPVYGYATVNFDCSVGTYYASSSITNTDSSVVIASPVIILDPFTYSVSDGIANNTATVYAEILVGGGGFCSEIPVSQITTIGGGQSPAVNATLQTTFTGYLTTTTGLTSGGKNSVKVCPDTTVDYETTASVGTALCTINGVAVANTGSVSIGDKLVCTNKPDGGDTDRFSVKSEE